MRNCTFPLSLCFPRKDYCGLKSWSLRIKNRENPRKKGQKVIDFQMGFLGLLEFAFKFFYLVAWPLFGLGFPLYASIRAMENNSNSEMRNLVAYWIIFNLISLFELVFLKLIYWLPFWPYMKLVAIFWLVLPHFSGAAYVYDCLLRPCLSVNPRVFIKHFIKPMKDLSLSTKSSLSTAEKYAKENGSEALEKLIDRKLNDTKLNIDVEEIKAVENTEEKETAATILVLHAGKTNKNALKTLIAAEYSGVQVGMAPDFEIGVSNKTPEFMKMNPIGKVPVLETPDGPVFESNAIARYVTCLKRDNPLYGSSLIETALINQWIDFASLEIDANVFNWFIPRMGGGGAVYFPPAEKAAISALKRALGALNTYLASNTYLVGHAVTLADIIMTVNLWLGFTHVMTTSFTSDFPHVERYFWTMVNQPNFSKILGEVKQTEKVPTVASTKKPSQPKETAKSKTKDKKKKKAKKKPAKPKEEAVEKEEAAPKPKPMNSLDLLPPSKMILNEWKRLYSNTKTNFREVAIKGLWDMYDPEGYSLWFCDYKYNEENTVSLVTLNKVGGFLQRMDVARKYAFGKMLVIGSEPPFKVKGVWLFRGQEIPQFVIDECYDMELYDWKKAELTDEEQKERVNQIIEDEEAFEGEPVLDAKCFK